MTALVEIDTRLSDADVERIADRLLERLRGHVGARRWMNTQEAAEYLGVGVDFLYKRTAAGTIPCHQDHERGPYYFLAEELDRWRTGAGVPVGRTGLALVS